MTTLRIDIEGNPKSISYRSFLDVGNNSLAILGDLDYAFSRRNTGAVDWYMSDLSINGILRVEVYSKVRSVRRKLLDDVSGQVAGSFVKGFGMLEKEGRSPEYLSSYGMARAMKMTQVIGNSGTHSIIASVPEKEVSVEITQISVKNLRQLIPESYKSVGSVEGTLEAISVHKKRVFVVYEPLFGKAVTCEFHGLDILDKVKESLGSRVMVRGVVSRNARSEPRKVVLERPEDFRVFGRDLKILPFKSLGGIDPDFTGGLETEEFIRRIRG